MGIVSKGPSPTQSNHVLWDSVDGPATNDSTFCHDCVGPVTSSCPPGTNTNSHEPNINAAGKGLMDAWKKEDLHGAWPVGSQGYVDGICSKSFLSVRPLKNSPAGFNCTSCHLPYVQCSNRSASLRRKGQRSRQLLHELRVLFGDHLDTAGNQLKHSESQSSHIQNMMAQTDKSKLEQVHQRSVQEAQHPSHAPGTCPVKAARVAKMKHAKLSRNLMKELHLGAAESAAAE